MSLYSLDAKLEPSQRIIAALDHNNWLEAEADLKDYAELIGIAKVNSIADRLGLDGVVESIAGYGLLTMIDYKYHDIDDTMRRRTREATLSNGSIITIHAAAGETALKAAIQGVDEALGSDITLSRPWLLGVTVLTPHDDMVCTSIYGTDRATKVRQFAKLAADIGLQGVVCSADEAYEIKASRDTEHLKVIVPAVRPRYAINKDEQRNIVTPKMAIESGADFIIVGRPLIDAIEYGITPKQAVQIIADEIAGAI